MTRTGLCLLGGSALGVVSAFVLVSPALAQQGITTSTSPASPPPASAPAAAGQLDEIVVTAQHRKENIQKASVSVAALGPEALVARGVTDSQSLNGVVPGLKLAYTGTSVQTFVRGVGDPTANAYSQPAVALNIDGVYVARSSAFGAVFFDTARVEVLRGPQGTLYGRNASGGAINIISNAPKLGEFSGTASIEGGNYNLVRAQGAVNIPVTDTFALRVAAQVAKHDGYLSDGGNDEDSQGLRVRALWQPSSDLSVLMTGEHGREEGKGFGRVYRPVLFGDPWASTQDPRGMPPLTKGIYLPHDNSSLVEADSASAEINWHLARGVTLTVIPGFRYVKATSNQAGDFLTLENDDSKQFSLEARLAGDTGLLKWVVGTYAYKENLSVSLDADQRTSATQSGQIADQIVPKLDTTASAAFGEATFSVTDKFRVIGGLRYTNERHVRGGEVDTTKYVNGNVTGQSSTSLDSSLKANAVTWKTGAEFDVAAQNMLYATVATGFKGGGFDAADQNAYKPEFLTAYTVGSKNRFFSNMLQLNLEGFYWKYKDQQTSFLAYDSTGAANFVTRNAGQATIYGLDADVLWKLTKADTIAAGGEYLHTTYDKFLYNTIGAPTPAGAALADGCVSGGPVAGVPGQYVENCSGHVLPRTPKWSGNVRYTHKFALENGADITGGLVVKYEADQVLGVNWSSPNFRQDAYELYDADLTYTAPSGRWNLQAYVRNIGNQAVYLAVSNATLAPATGPIRSSVAAIGSPRTFGVRLQANF